MKRDMKFLSIVLAISLATVFTAYGFSESQQIPDWIKNNAKWWFEGTISDAEYLDGIKYLITNGILSIPIPIEEITAAKSPVSDSDRVQSISVSFFDGPIPGKYTVDTFSKFRIVGENNDALSDSMTFNFGDEPKFYLESLPSKDKSKIYNFINNVYFSNRESTIKSFNVNVDMISGDGVIIQTWHYSQCRITGYGTYLQDVKNLYSFGDNESAEFRDRMLFTCKGVSLTS